MWILALFLIMLVIWVLVSYWPLTVTGLVIWVLVARTRHVAAVPGPAYPRPVPGPVHTRPVPTPVRTRPEPTSGSTPARVLPAPDYLPRWTADRRLATGREHAQWQETFDNEAL